MHNGGYFELGQKLKSNFGVAAPSYAINIFLCAYSTILFNVIVLELQNK